MIYVSTNYRLHGTISSCDTGKKTYVHWQFLALGFLGGKEAQAAKIGNVGIRDRRHLVQLHIIFKC